MNTIAVKENLIQRKAGGLSSFSIKVLALALMTLDHIYYYLGGTVLEIPFIFTLLGRISAPLFIFAMAEGFVHTHDRKAYLKRLYIAAVLMSLGNFLVNKYLPHPGGAMVVNGMFATLFLVGLYIWGIEFFIKGIKTRQKKLMIKAGFMLGIPMMSGAALIILMDSPLILGIPGQILFNALFMLFPSPVLVEGSIFWVALGLGFYFLRNHKGWLAAFYSLMSGFFFISALEGGLSLTNIFLLNNQWFMIFALIFILLYNGEKGRKMKYAFYIYYPLHVYLLVLLARLIMP